jgi:hypothetical protein
MPKKSTDKTCQRTVRHLAETYESTSRKLTEGRLWYAEPNAVNNAIGYAKFFSRSHDDAGNVIETHEPRTRNFLSYRLFNH